MVAYERKDLGEFSSIVCLKAIIFGFEGVIGKMAVKSSLILAGRKRGQSVAQALGLTNTNKSIEEWSALITDTLGKPGTRLCVLRKVDMEDTLIRVYLSDTMCSSGEELGSSRELDFTLGVIQGALEVITERKMKGRQTGSVLRGESYDIVEYTYR